MTGILRAGLDALTKLLGAEPHQQDVVFSEASAKRALAGPLSRRGLFRAAGAVAAGTLFVDAVPATPAQIGSTLVQFDDFLKKRWTDKNIEHLMFVSSVARFELGSQWRVSDGSGPSSIVTVTGICTEQGIITVSS